MLTGPFVQTVLGPIAPRELGQTLIHEHLLIDNPSFVEPDGEAERVLAHQPLGLANLGWIRRNWTSNADNLVLDDEALAIREVAAFAALGGRTIVDATVPGIRRDPSALARISRATGLHVVMGAGAYVEPTHPPEVRHLDRDALAAIVIEEWRNGVAGTGSRPGLIGEIGCVWPLHPRERLMLQAMADAQRATGLPLMIHPGRNPEAPGEIATILEAAGADLERVAMAHLDRTLTEPAQFVALAAGGVYLELDCFGLESSYYPFDPAMATPSDAQRLAFVRALLDAGLGARILLSHDICTKHRLAAFGGHGFGHLTGAVVPWMHQRGFTASETEMMLVDNPARLLAVTPA
jgi:phosphotriesterase-related protein